MSNGDRGASLAMRLIAFWTAGVALWGSGASAAAPSSDTPNKDQDLQEIVVTGTLIRSTDVQAFTPVLTITAEDIQAKGFADVAEALQRVSFATGSVQNGQFYNGFTPGAKVTSFFGLDPSYTRYMINGLPFANYPALYNGSESFVSIAGIRATASMTMAAAPTAGSRSPTARRSETSTS